MGIGNRWVLSGMFWDIEELDIWSCSLDIQAQKGYIHRWHGGGMIRVFKESVYSISHSGKTTKSSALHQGLSFRDQPAM